MNKFVAVAAVAGLMGYRRQWVAGVHTRTSACRA